MDKQKQKEQEVKIRFDPVLNRFIEVFEPFRPRKVKI